MLWQMAPSEKAIKDFEAQNSTQQILKTIKLRQSKHFL